MVLYVYMRILLLYLACQLSEESRASDSGHVLKTDLVATVLHDVVNHSHIIFYSMNRRIGDREGHLGDHATLLGILNAQTEVPVVIQTTERT